MKPLRIILVFLIAVLAVRPIFAQADPVGSFFRHWNLPEDAKLYSHQEEKDEAVEDWIIYSPSGFTQLIEEKKIEPMNPESSARAFLPREISEKLGIDSSQLKMTFIGGSEEPSGYYIITICTYPTGQIARFTKPKKMPNQALQTTTRTTDNDTHCHAGCFAPVAPARVVPDLKR
jgi:hypothetical protein